MHPHERYSPQPNYAYPSSRSATPNLGNGVDARRLPPLSTTPGPQGDRWQQSYLPQQNGYHGNSIRSPIATYPTAYPNYFTSTQANAYPYHMQAGPHDHLSNMNPQGHGLYDDMSRMDPRSASPYGRGSGSSSHVPPARSYSPPPVTPISPEEPTIKKKRKRADAAQLKVLNETYTRTAFPSTEERIALAKMLDMSARSVQIWFQNKRQSMRQTNRQSTSVASSHHPFSVGNQVDPMAEDLVPHHQPYDTGSGPMGDAMYLTDASRSHASHSHSHATPSHYHTSSSHRHPREQDSVDPRKWPRGS
ncbi:hypothetical protein BJ912DRAFT_577138 [Pholiota molesta]|nr:hypothetical protein BJ912DRAFT_577138 [Pholiota molesta]